MVPSPGYTKGDSASRLPSGYSPAGRLTGGCEGEDGVDGGLERPCVALDLGQQEAAQQGGEQRHGEVVGVDAGRQRPGSVQGAQPDGDGGRPPAEAGRDEGAGFGIGLRELAAERPERAPAPGVAGTGRGDDHVTDRDLARWNPQRTASFRRAKWNRTALAREVRVFGVTRTVPASEQRDLVKAVGSRFTAKSETELDPAVITAAERVLGKPMTGYVSLGVDSARKIILYAAPTQQGTYSEFHFGAGEASIIKIISGVETAPDNSLILIEETRRSGRAVSMTFSPRV